MRRSSLPRLPDRISLLRRFLRSFLLAASVVVVLAGGVGIWGYAVFDQPGPFRGDRIVILERGAGLARISDTLHEAGVLSHGAVFRAGVRFLGNARNLKAGEYEFPSGASPREVMNLLVSGQTVVRKLTVPEGLTTVEILDLIGSTDALVGPVVGAGASLPAEGTLLPETYHYSYGDTRIGLVDRMRSSLREVLAETWRNRAPDLPLRSMEEALILASIVERETAIESERARIAGVFVNRLRRGMRLQSDPTVAYGLTAGRGRLDRPLSRADLQFPTAYNTYLIDGLPPTPISNPGRAAIAATLAPEATEHLYFVADGTGGHAFARTLAEHLRNVANWRRVQAGSNAGTD